MSSYDTQLLASAPEATREQLQEGYNPNLLQSGKKKDVDAELDSPNGKEGYPPSTSFAQASSSRRAVPWFRTTRGIIIIVVVALVIIAAVIGGAVGGTRHKHKNELTVANSTASASSTSSSTSSNSSLSMATQGTGPTSTNSSTTTTAAAGIRERSLLHRQTHSGEGGEGGLRRWFRMEFEALKLLKSHEWI
ncbi:hypothetical protein BDP27DRAFT_294725 [Rhodocollybia butyracea]|uniref:Uncharacterized protein n=1 Tax=Rhodocollybia butyracea TaxID=206335 RepID=A0A9P5U1D1_9AGAR|nr:hypothetical protein BDP27DRAFT_294725 [Rhodocollybia butyracea]